MFEGFDFSILDDPDFKEDSVREELIAPLLNELGYSAAGEHRIVRGRPLIHPYVYIGTQARKINIIPDYILHVAGSPKWVLDAKAPNEDTRTGKNVEQAFSYAIHKDVRVFLYAICNGHVLTVFHVSRLEPVLDVELKDIGNRWEEVRKMLSPMAFIDPTVLNFVPDYGLTMLKAGGSQFESIWFPYLRINFVSKLSDTLYTLVTSFESDREYVASFDLDASLFSQFLDVMPANLRQVTVEQLTNQPFQLVYRDGPEVSVKAKLSTEVQSNDREQYVPFIVSEVSHAKLKEEIEALFNSQQSNDQKE